MRNITQYETCKVAGGVAMEHSGKNIIITIAYGETFQFNSCNFTWAGAYNTGFGGWAGSYVRLIQQGEICDGYHINYSMGSNAIAQYTLIPEQYIYPR